MQVYRRAFDLGLIAMVVLVPLVFEKNWVFVAFYTKFLVFQALLCVLYAIWLLKRPVAFQSSPLLLPLVLYVTLCALSIFCSANPVEALVHIAQHIGLLLFFWVLLNNLDPGDLPRYFPPIVVTTTLVAFTGILQFAGWGMHWIPSAGLPSGTMGYRNYAAMYTILSLPLAVFLFVKARKALQKGLWGFSIALMLTFLICTRTRGAWLGLGAACLITGLVWIVLKRHTLLDRGWSYGHTVIALAGIALTVLFTVAVPPNMGARGLERQNPAKLDLVASITTATTNSSVENRMHLWRHTLEMILDAPFLGVGMGNWQFTYPAYDGGDTIWKGMAPRRPHNDYLWVASELGLPGLLVFLWFLAIVLLRVLRLYQTTPSQRLFALCLGTALLAIMGHAFFSFPRERIAPSMLTWILIAFVAVSEKERTPSRLRVWSFVPRAGFIVLLFTVWLGFRGVLFDRHFAHALGYVRQQAWDHTIRTTTTALYNGLFDPQVLLIRGVAHFHKGDFQAAVKDNLLCLDYHPYLINALNNLGMAYNGLGQYEKAIPVLKRIPDIDRDHVEAHANLGLAYQGLKRYDEAIASFKEALARNQSDPNELRYYLATTYEQQDSIRQATGLYAQILKDNPRDTRTLYRSGVIFQRLQHYDRAIRAFQKTLQFLPDYPPAHYSLGEIHLIRADTARAIASFEAFLEVWQGNPQPVRVVRQKLETLR